MRQWKLEKIDLRIEFQTTNICPIMLCNISHITRLVMIKFKSTKMKVSNNDKIHKY